METSKTDMYGVTEQEASNMLVTFLHDTLQEPQADLDGLYLQDGRWQSHVNNSERGIRVVFLQQHNGHIEPGHMTDDAHPESTLKRW